MNAKKQNMLIYVRKCVKPNHFYFIYFLLLYEMPVNSFEFNSGSPCFLSENPNRKGIPL